MTLAETRSRGVRAGITVALAAAYVALAATVVVPAPLAVVLLAAGIIAAEIVFARAAPYLLPEILRLQLGLRFRLLSVDVLIAVLAARSGLGAGLVAATIGTVVLLHGTRDADGILARRTEWRRNGGPVSWRNFSVPGLPTPKSARLVPELSVPLSALTLVLPIAFTLAAATGRVGWALAGVLVVVIASALVLVVRGAMLAWRSRRSRDRVRAMLRVTLEQLAPEVVLHFSGRRGTTPMAADWVPTLRWLTQRCVVLVREPSHLDALAGTDVPVVFAPLSTDVELFMVESINLALYPTDVTNINNHLLRVPGIYDVLIGHGDSDEPENSSPIARMYDEIWVAGPLGRDRYAPAAIGVPAARIRELGPLPMVARDAPATFVREPDASASDAPAATVLYAPAWESVLDSTDLSSLRTAGARIVGALLALPDVRVQFAPASATGSRLPEYLDEAARLARLVRAAGGQVLTASELSAALAHADLVITDISPIVADAVELDRPYAVPTRADWTVPAMVAAYPTLRAGEVLDLSAEPGPDADAGLAEHVARILAADTHSDDRATLRRALIGRADPAEFQARFQRAVDDALARQASRRAFERPPVAIGG